MKFGPMFTTQILLVIFHSTRYYGREAVALLLVFAIFLNRAIRKYPYFNRKNLQWNLCCFHLEVLIVDMWVLLMRKLKTHVCDL
jgi:hypothetical protein